MLFFKTKLQAWFYSCALKSVWNAFICINKETVIVFRRPEITILSAEPLTATSWYPGASGRFSSTAFTTQPVWSESVLSSAQVHWFIALYPQQLPLANGCARQVCGSSLFPQHVFSFYFLRHGYFVFVFERLTHQLLTYKPLWLKNWSNSNLVYNLHCHIVQTSLLLLVTKTKTIQNNFHYLKAENKIK